MKKGFLVLAAFGVACFAGNANAASVDCAPLCDRYKAPNPASKTMAQLERWVKNRVADDTDAANLKECLLTGAADNPNQANYAGKGSI